ncbi:MAG: hypothetical protein U9N59_00005, partial [Campylobacterota bacterium]|nr:hypothetical protein [Campylobacterota bacterium]
MRLKSNNFLYLLCLISSLLYAKDSVYDYHHIHAQTVPMDTVEVGLGYILLNDTVDILNLKEEEFGGTKQFDTIGDLSGYDFFIRYGFSDDLLIYYKNNELNIEYGSKDIINSSNEIYSRYNFQDKVSFDFGFIYNKLYDFYITDLDDINQLGKRYFGSENFDMEQTQNQIKLTQNNNYIILQYYPWLGLEDTSDSSIYLRLISDINSGSLLFDYYGGVKYTKIKNKIVANQELVDIDSTILKDLSRDEMMFFLGFNTTYEINDIFIELGYEYDRFSRDEGLDYIDFNHIVDLTLGYNIDKNFMIYT